MRKFTSKIRSLLLDFLAEQLLKAYRSFLAFQIDKRKVPKRVAIIVDGRQLEGLGAIEKLREIRKWCDELGVRDLVLGIEGNSRINPIVTRGDRVYVEEDGKDALVEVTKRLAKMALEGGLRPEEINETIVNDLIKERLPVEDVDLVIRLSRVRILSDALVWQIPYSEFVFMGTSLERLRKEDFLRAIRTFQARKRRFGS